jgi:hypothetical protein
MPPILDDPRSTDASTADPRVRAAFRAWLEGLAIDADAATAASMAYGELSPAGRDAWLDAVAAEAVNLRAPPLAMYSPALAIEEDPARRARILAALGEHPLEHLPPLRALAGHNPAGESVAAFVIPLYLDFVEALVCRFRPEAGVLSARKTPMLRAAEVWADASPLAEVEGARLAEVPVSDVLDDLALALLADRRCDRAPPAELVARDFLFSVHPTSLLPPPAPLVLEP